MKYIILVILVTLSSCVLTPSYYKEQQIVQDDRNVIAKYFIRTHVWHLGNIVWSEYVWSDNVKFLDSLAPIHSAEADTAIAIFKRRN